MNNIVNIPTYIEIKGCTNLRHLGGYHKNTGGITSSSRFFRSAMPTKDVDTEALRKLGIKHVVDVREEIEKHGEHPLRDNFILHSIHLAGEVIQPHEIPTWSMPEMYMKQIENRKDKIKEALETIASLDGGVLFHCSAGKDRTGMLAALLFLNAGVSREDILREYMYTSLIHINRTEALERMDKINSSIMKTSEEYLNPILEIIETKYGGISKYFENIGLSERTAEKLRF
jgi:protein-tyrosine phosphatase